MSVFENATNIRFGGDIRYTEISSNGQRSTEVWNQDQVKAHVDQTGRLPGFMSGINGVTFVPTGSGSSTSSPNGHAQATGGFAQPETETRNTVEEDSDDEDDVQIAPNGTLTFRDSNGNTEMTIQPGPSSTISHYSSSNGSYIRQEYNGGHITTQSVPYVDFRNNFNYHMDMGRSHSGFRDGNGNGYRHVRRHERVYINNQLVHDRSEVGGGGMGMHSTFQPQPQPPIQAQTQSQATDDGIRIRPIPTATDNHDEDVPSINVISDDTPPPQYQAVFRESSAIYNPSAGILRTGTGANIRYFALDPPYRSGISTETLSPPRPASFCSSTSASSSNSASSSTSTRDRVKNWFGPKKQEERTKKGKEVQRSSSKLKYLGIGKNSRK